MTISINSSVELARSEFLEWAKVDGKLGEGRYAEVAAKVTAAAQGLQRREMEVHNHWFRFGFSFAFGEMPGVEKYFPIPSVDRLVMNYHAKKDTGNVWPLKDLETGEYFLPIVTWKDISPPSGSMPTDQYFTHCLRMVSVPSETSIKIKKMFEALTPYAQQIRDSSGIRIYRQIAAYNPNYPEFQETIDDRCIPS